MPLFGRRQATDAEVLAALREEVGALRAELARQASVIRQVETEQGVMHDQVRKWMRRAVAAERAVERNQEPDAAVGTPLAATPATPARPLWGARARIAARRAGRGEQLSAESVNGEGGD